MDIVTKILCSLGIYSIMQPVWEWLEILELGEANATLVDTVICYAIALLVAHIVVEEDL